MITNPKKIEAVLTKGVEQILPSKKELRDLMRKRKIRLYLGIDPTSPKLHLGHAIPLRKLKQFQDLGHEVILLVGTFTAQVGDPSERDKKRKPLTLAQIKKNMVTYRKQAAKILDLSKAKIKHNADWLAKLKFGDLVKLTSHFTVSRLLERDMFQRRLKRREEVWLSELLYPLMQGYDSVAMNVDLEVGATDQTFNMLVGRKLQRIYNKKEKFILTTPMLIGLDGREMSKTYGNVVNLTDKPNEMYGKIMSLKDDLIIHYFELCTEVSLPEIKKMKKVLKSKRANPRDLKAKLAREIVTIYHSRKAALAAEKEFERVFKKKKFPSKISGIKIKEKSLNILSFLVKTKLVSSRSEAKRLILQRGVEIDGFLKEDWREVIKIKKGMIIKVGKRRFAKIT
ncbi:MAG: tyrosine--tRNA ligase [Candidatus Paceibacterales bacterium]